MQSISGEQRPVSGPDPAKIRLLRAQDRPIVAVPRPANPPQSDAAPARLEATPPGGPPAPPRPPAHPAARGLQAGLVLAGVLVLLAVLLLMRYGLPRAMAVVPVQAGAFQSHLIGPGTLDATGRAKVGASLQGAITRLPVDRNDLVRVGQILAEVSAQDVKAGLDAAIASHRAAQNAVEGARAEVIRAEATLRNARATLLRQQELQASGALAQSALDAAQTAADQAAADLARALSALRQSEAQQAAAQATVAANRALLDKSVVRAPIDGVVIARHMNLGDLAAPGNPIVEIVDPASIVITARFDESAIAAVQAGQAASIRFLSQSGPQIAGRVHRIGREVDGETREFTVDVAPDGLPANWAIGQRGTVEIRLAPDPQALSLPPAAIARRQGQAGIWLVTAGRAQWQPVTLGRIGPAGVEVMAGLQPGDLVLAEPEGAFAWMRVDPRSVAP